MTIPAPVLRAVVEHARESQPNECCGMLVGKGDIIHASAPARNLRNSPTGYEIDPRDHVAALRRARVDGLDVIGFYHSHPHSAPNPSPTDLAEASYPEAAYLIVGMQEGAWESRLFRFVDGTAQEIEIVVTDEDR